MRTTPYGILRFISLTASDVERSLYEYGDIRRSIYDVGQMRAACDKLFRILESHEARNGECISILDVETGA